MPNNPVELQKIITDANGAKNVKIMPVGAGRSQGRQFLPEGGTKHLVVDLSNFNHIDIDNSNKTATVGAGVSWIDIQKEAPKRGLALQVMQASNVFSAGGSIGTNIHGWNHRKGVLSNTILSMDIVTPTGELRQGVKPDDPLFQQVAGGLGLFGTVVSVKFKLTDNELLVEKGKEIPIENYVKHFTDNVFNKEDKSKHKHIRMHLYRLSLDPDDLLGSGVAVDYVREGEKKFSDKKSNLSEETHRGTRFNQVMLNLARRFGWVRKKYWEGEKARLLANDSPAMTINEIMQPPINALFNPSVSEAEWLQEYFLPGDNLAAFLKELGKLLKDNQVPHY
ncbi:FAD-binding oxidoreductase [Legionella hackeliae]|uniref:FAD-binding oxidoreductase n=1 Tax=Legionella hackeliae TaxID=449 RepID=UPI0005D3ADAE|nr:FAD-binding oxidoreductase [Legionella hackeliae]KTD09874.1 cytokinin oxidase [Legionella hackeliae]STX47532.1 cytokinin oxidase [Legionella hackeliae]